MSHSRNFDLNYLYNTEEGNNLIENLVVNLDDDGSPSSHGDQTDVVDELLSEGDLNIDHGHIIPLHEGMAFTDSDEVLEYCHGFGKANGFQIRIRSFEKLKDGAKHIVLDKYKRLRLECSRAGMFESKTRNPGKGSSSSATGCLFKSAP